MQHLTKEKFLLMTFFYLRIYKVNYILMHVKTKTDLTRVTNLSLLSISLIIIRV